MFQPLEKRILMADVSVVLSKGTLTITGTSGVDDIYVSPAVGEKISIDNANVEIASFDKTKVKRIVATGKDGADRIWIDGNVNVPVTLDGGAGNDTLYGSSGNDLLKGGTENDNLQGGYGNDRVEGGAGDDQVGGNNDNDTLLGGDGDDDLNGGSEDDLMDGGLGADGFSGGTGRDTVTYAGRKAKVIVDISDVADKRNNDGEAGEGDDVWSDIEIVIGGSGNDRLEGVTTTVPNNVNVDYDNQLVGNGGNDTLIGLDGNDILNGGNGTDDFVGGSGRDVADYSDRKQSLTLNLDGEANDGARGESDEIGDDIEELWAGSGNDKLTGNAADNVLKGFGGNDVLDGGLGGDVLLGGDGNDTATYASRSADLVIDIDGQDDDGEADENDNVKRDIEKIIGGSGDDEILGSVRDNTLDGRAGNDTLIGLAGDDTLKGGAGDDELRGNAGVDRLLAGIGADSLFAKGDKKIDFLDGGKGDDQADADEKDILKSIETT